MRCPKCDTKLKPTAKFCKECGTRIAPAQGGGEAQAPAPRAEARPAARLCANGHPMEPEWAECPHCLPTTPESLSPTGVEPSTGAESQTAAGVALLIGLNQETQGKTFHLQLGENILGADPNCNIVLDDQYISRRHANITIEGRRFVLTDLDSRNGTFVNDTRTKAIELRDDDTIRLGVNTMFQFKRLR